MSFQELKLHSVKIPKTPTPEKRALKRAHFLAKKYNFASVIDTARREQGEWQWGGTGDYVLIERCPTSQISFFDTEDETIARLNHIDRTGCGHACHGDHYVGKFTNGQYAEVGGPRNLRSNGAA